MKVEKSRKKRIELAPTCFATEHQFDLDDMPMNIATIELNGKYPLKGFVNNLKVHEFARVISGIVSLRYRKSKGFEIEVKTAGPGEVLFIPKDVQFAWESFEDVVFDVTCSPAWWAEQHVDIEE